MLKKPSLCVVLLAGVLLSMAQRPGGQPEIQGTFTGSYVCNQRQISLQLSLEPKGTSQLAGIFTFYTPGTDPSKPLGAFRVDGTFEPTTGVFRLLPTSWVKPAMGYMTVGLTGTYDAASGKVKGNLQAPGCLPFELARDENATRRAAEEAAAREKRFANAPTSLSQARDPAEQCLVVGKWYSRFKSEYADTDILSSMADQLQNRAMNLFLDEEFVPVFGKTLERMQDPERQQMMLLVRRCADQQTDRGDHFMYQNTLQWPFRVAADAISLLAYRRTLRQQKQQLLQELPALPANGQSTQRVATLRDAELKTYEVLWPSEYRALTKAVETAAVRLAAPGLESWVNTVIAGASGHEGLASVMAARRRLTGARPTTAGTPTARPLPNRPGGGSAPSSSSEAFLTDASPEARTAAEAKLRAKAEALVAQLVAEERAKLSALGSGADALQAGTVWYARFNTAFADFQSDPAVRDALAAFETRRKQDLAAGGDAVLARVNQAQTAPQVSAVTAGYLGVPSDRSDPAAAKILSAAAAREKTLATAAARAEVEARSVTNFCKTLKADDVTAGSGEPSTRDMCMALADQYDGVNDTIRDRKAACERGDYKNNPALGMQCLGLCAGTFGTCDVSFSLTRFQKIACEKAQGKPGFVCDFVVRFSASNAQMQQMLATVGGSGSVTQGRFVKAAGGWIKLAQ
jgi:hypothetical protein